MPISNAIPKRTTYFMGLFCLRQPSQFSRATALPEWREGCSGKGEVDEAASDPDGVPFDIPMHGLGLFSCRRAAWPGLNYRFRGSGGEEGCIHEKFRQRGGRVLCVLFLRRAHRISPPKRHPYPNLWLDRIRNYIIGFREIGWNTAPLNSTSNHILAISPPAESSPKSGQIPM